MKIVIRKAKYGDAEGIANVRNEGLRRKVSPYIATNEIADKKKIKQMNNQYKDKNFVCLLAILNKKVIGCVSGNSSGKNRTKHVLEMGWMIHPDYHGKGIGTKLLKAFCIYAKKKGYKKLEADVVIENKPSLRIAKKNGFKIEGKKIKSLRLDNGKYVDVYNIGKLI